MALAKIYIFPMNSISIFLITLIVSFFHNGVNSEEPSEPFIVPEKGELKFVIEMTSIHIVEIFRSDLLTIIRYI